MISLSPHFYTEVFPQPILWVLEWPYGRIAVPVTLLRTKREIGWGEWKLSGRRQAKKKTKAKGGTCVFGANLSEPHINRDNGPHVRNNGMYVSFTPCLSHPGSRDPCTPSNAPCISVYWCAHVRGLQLDWTARTTVATRVCCEDYRRRQVGKCADTWYKRIQPTQIV